MCLVAGQGPPVVFVHGYTAGIAEWNFVWNKLVAKGFRVIAFDQRGHGGSTLGSDGIGSETMADDVAAILRHFDIRDGVLVGHSMGGFVTIRAMIEQPDLASGCADWCCWPPGRVGCWMGRSRIACRSR